MEDVRIGRRGRSFHVHLPLTAAQRNACGASPDRVQLILGPPDVGTVTYDIENVVSVGDGFVIPAGFPPVVLTIKDNYDLVTRAWVCIGGGGATMANIYETLLTDEQGGSV